MIGVGLTEEIQRDFITADEVQQFSEEQIFELNRGIKRWVDSRTPKPNWTEVIRWTPLTLDDVVSLWPAVLNHIQTRNSRFFEFLRGATPIAVIPSVTQRQTEGSIAIRTPIKPENGKFTKGVRRAFRQATAANLPVEQTAIYFSNVEQAEAYAQHLLKKSSPSVRALIKYGSIAYLYNQETGRHQFYYEVVDVDVLKTMPYKDYQRTVWWQNVRHEKLQLAGNRCQLCNRPGPGLHVHHRTYERRGSESLDDLTVLCEICHSFFHRHSKLYQEWEEWLD